jgi:BolA protein
MMNPIERKAEIEVRLKNVFEPDLLEVIDESHLHAGHAGARDGRGHFRVHIVAAFFAGIAPLKRHRMVYQALGELMDTEIHALAIDAEVSK